MISSSLSIVYANINKCTVKREIFSTNSKIIKQYRKWSTLLQIILKFYTNYLKEKKYINALIEHLTNRNNNEIGNFF